MLLERLSLVFFWMRWSQNISVSVKCLSHKRFVIWVWNFGHSQSQPYLSTMVDLPVNIRTIRNTNPIDCGISVFIGWKDSVHSAFSPCFIYWNTDQVKHWHLEGSHSLELDTAVQRYQGFSHSGPNIRPKNLVFDRWEERWKICQRCSRWTWKDFVTSWVWALLDQCDI